MNCRVYRENQIDKFIPDGNYIVPRTLCKPFSADFAPNFDVFSAIRLNCEVDFLTGKFLEICHFPSVLVVVAKAFEKGFLGSFISKYVFPVIAN